jgi:hypothetical protein
MYLLFRGKRMARKKRTLPQTVDPFELQKNNHDKENCDSWGYGFYWYVFPQKIISRDANHINWNDDINKECA